MTVSTVLQSFLCATPVNLNLGPHNRLGHSLTARARSIVDAMEVPQRSLHRLSSHRQALVRPEALANRQEALVSLQGAFPLPPLLLLLLLPLVPRASATLAPCAASLSPPLLIATFDPAFRGLDGLLSQHIFLGVPGCTGCHDQPPLSS